MKTTTTSLSRRLTAAVGATMLALLSAPGCQSADPVPSTAEAPHAATDEALGESSSELAGCTCITKGSCATLSYSDKPANGTYYITQYTGKGQSCTSRPADGTWAYIADSARFGCGAKVKITANGKSCVAEVADCGPNRCVEEAATGKGAACKTHFPIIDASPLITKYLFNVSSAGYSDKFTVQAEVVGASEAIGCGTQTSDDGDDDDDDSGAGGSGSAGSSSGESGSGGSGGEQRQQCKTDADCGGGDAKCDHNTTPALCVTRKEIGEACSADKDCNGGLEGTSRVCEQGKCADACHQDSDCAAGSDCKKTGNATVGKCIDNGNCVIEYPSVTLQGVKAPADFVKSYKDRGAPSGTCPAPPSCVIDVNQIIDAKTRKTLSRKMVKLAPHVALEPMIGKLSGAKDHYVFFDPTFIKDLEATIVSYGKPTTLRSGFRSAQHQADVCKAMCGKPTCSRGKKATCAKCSRHMSGKAADLEHSPKKCDLAKASCSAGKMHYIYNESDGGDHLHIDQGPQNRLCTYAGISCK